MTEPFTLEYGVEFEGKRHFEGEMRLPTLEDMECALEAVPEGACKARIDRHVWARTITRLGEIPQESITPQLLATVADTDYGSLLAAEALLRKKLKPANATPESENSDSPK